MSGVRHLILALFVLATSVARDTLATASLPSLWRHALSQSEPSHEDMEADIAAVNTVREREVVAIASGEANTAYLAADAVLMPPNEPRVSGIDAMEAMSCAEHHACSSARAGGLGE